MNIQIRLFGILILTKRLLLLFVNIIPIKLLFWDIYSIPYIYRSTILRQLWIEIVPRVVENACVSVLAFNFLLLFSLGLMIGGWLLRLF